MAVPRARGTVLFLFVVFGVALAGRLYGVFSSTLFEPVASDAAVFDDLAQRILTGDGFFSPLEPAYSYRPPLYPAFLALIYAFAGHSYLAVRIVQAVLGSVTVLLVYHIGDRLLGQRTGRLAAFLTGIYPLFLVLPRALITETFYIFLFVLFIALFIRLADHPAWNIALIAGIVLGLAGLTREVAVAFAVLAIGWLVMVSPITRKQLIGLTVWLGLGIGLTILPWTLRNYRIHHQFVLIATEGGLGFWAANNATLQPSQLLSPEITKFADQFEPYDELQLRAMGWRNVMTFVRENPRQYLLLCLRRFVAFWTPYLPFVKYKIPWLLLLGTSGISIMVMRRQWRQVLFLYLVIGYHALVCTLLIAEPRYHVPLIPLLIIITSGGLSRLYERGVRVLQ